MNIQHLDAALRDGDPKIRYNPVTISVKIDGSSLVIENQLIGPAFYSRGGNKLIDFVTRGFNKIYDDAIDQVMQFDSWEKLPPYHKVFVELTGEWVRPTIKGFPTSSIPRVSTVRDPSGKYLEPNLNIVNECAQILRFGNPPVIFSGKLTEVQCDQLYSGFGGAIGRDFRNAVETVFPGSAETISTVYGSAIIEGLVIYAESGVYKVIDPQFQADMKVSKDTQGDYMVILQRAILKTLFEWQSIVFARAIKSEREYFEMMSEFTSYIEPQISEQMKAFDVDIPEPWFGMSELAQAAAPKLTSKHWPHIYRILCGMYSRKIRVKANEKIGLSAYGASCIEHDIKLIWREMP